MVVKSRYLLSFMLSYPMIATSSGTRSPRRLIACNAPKAIESLRQKIASGNSLILEYLLMASNPASSVNPACLLVSPVIKYSFLGLFLSFLNASLNPFSRSMEVLVLIGVLIIPIRSYPDLMRCSPAIKPP